MTRRDLLRHIALLPIAGPILARLATPPSLYGPGTVLLGRMAGPAERWSISTVRFMRGDWDLPRLAFKGAQGGGGWILDKAGAVRAFVQTNGDIIDFGPHVIGVGR